MGSLRRTVFGVIAGLGFLSAGWAQAPASWCNPVSNPVYNDTAFLRGEISLVHAYQALPNQVSTVGGKAALDGDLNAFAVQAEVPVSDCLSLVAIKSLYLDFNPDQTLSKESGFIDLAAGLKLALVSQENYACTLRTTVEFPTGDDDVFQGNGEGNVSPALLFTWLNGNVGVNAAAGAVVPFNDAEESAVGYMSVGAAYRFTERLSTMLEVNWYRVLQEGDGDKNFDNQLPGLARVIDFEGGDLVNFGASNAESHADQVTAALGLRYQVLDNANLGVAYEIPVTPEETGVMDYRVTTNLSLTF